MSSLIRPAALALLIAALGLATAASGVLTPLVPLAPGLTALTPGTALACGGAMTSSDTWTASTGTNTSYSNTRDVVWRAVWVSTFCYAVHYASPNNGSSAFVITGTPAIVESYNTGADGTFRVNWGTGFGGPAYRSCTTTAQTTCGSWSTGGTWQNTLVVDSVAPSAPTISPASGSNLSANTSYTFSASWSDASPSSGQHSPNAWCGGTASTCTPVSGATATYTTPASGTFTACAQTEDNALNWGQKGCSTVSITPADSTPPAVSLYFNANSSTSYTGTTTSPSLHWSVSDPESGGSYTLNSPSGCSSGLTFSAGVPVSGDWTPCGISTPGHVYTFTLSATSSGGTGSVSAYYTYQPDNTAPYLGLTGPATTTVTNPSLSYYAYDSESAGSWNIRNITTNTLCGSSSSWVYSWTGLTACGITSGVGNYDFRLSASSSGGSSSTDFWVYYNPDTTPPQLTITPATTTTTSPILVPYTVYDPESAGTYSITNSTNSTTCQGSTAFSAATVTSTPAVSCSLVFGYNTLIISATSLGGTSSTSAITNMEATLTVTPDAQSRTYGQAAPSYTYTVTGFQNGENAGTAPGYVAPVCTSAYTSASPVSSSPLTINCSGGSATHYIFTTSATALLTISAAFLATLSVTGTTSPATYGTTQILGTSGGNGTGAITYSAGSSTACSISSNILTITAGSGTCAVTAAKATDGNYNSATSAPVSITVQPAAQAVLAVTGTTSPATYGTAQTLGTSGGNGTGAVTYSTGSSTACSVSSNILTVTAGAGTCAVSATKAADTNYNSATSSAVSITVQPAAQATLTVTGTTSPAVFGATETLGTSGGSGPGAITYSTGSSTACSVSSNILTITAGTGTCTVTVTKAADANYDSATSAPATITVQMASQATLTVTGATSPAAYGTTQTLGTSGGSGTGAITYSAGASTACSVSSNILTITAGAGSCAVSATKAADGNYNSTTSAPVTITVQMASQSALTVTGTTSPAAYGTTQTLGSSGGSGTGAVTYSTGSSTACSVAGFTLTITAATGTCAVTVTKAADGNYNSATSAQVTITVQKAAQATLTVTGTTSPASYGTTQTLGTSGGSGTGPVTYSTGSSTACSVSGNILTITAGTGICAVTATQAADSNYNSIDSAPATITVGPANQATLTVTGTTSPATYGTTQTLGTSGGSGTGAITYSTGSSTACSVSSNLLTITAGTGTCAVSATKAADGNYNSTTSAPVTITVQPAGQSALTVTGATSPAAYGTTQTLDTSGGSGTGAVTYSTGASTACSVSSNILTITAGTGTCAVTATQAADANYSSTTSAPVSITVQKATPATLTVTGSTSPAAYGATQTLSTSGGNGTGAVTYSVGSSTACSVSSNLLTITAGSGTCAIAATQAADSNYNSITSAPVSVTVQPAVQAALSVTGATSPASYGAVQTLGTSGGNGTGAVTYSTGSSTACSVSSNTLTITAATGSCAVSATKAADGNYNSATSAPVPITVQMASQATLTVTGTTSPASYGATQTLGTSGGSGTGPVTYSTGSSTACSVSSNILTITAATGTCAVSATKAADGNYNSATSAQVPITVQKAAQAILTVTGTTSPATYGTTQTLGTSGGNGFGTITYSAGSSTACSVSGNTLTLTSGSGTCAVTVTKGADAKYNSATSAPVSITVQTASQATLTVTGTTSPAAYGDTQTLGTSGGSGTGAVTYSTGSSTACSVSNNILTITAATGTCAVTATKAADSNYSSVDSAPVTITVGPTNQATLTITGATSPATYGTTQTLGTSGGSGSGTVTYSTGASTACSVLGNILTITAASGTCAVIATKAADSNYSSVDSAPVSIAVRKANQATLTITGATSPAAYGDTQTLGTSGGSGTGAVTYGTGSSTACSVSDHILTITSGAGTCAVSATQAADVNYNSATSAPVSITVNRISQASLTVTGTTSPAAFGASQTLGTSGGNGTGTVTYSTGASTACSVSGNILTITAASGICAVSATKAADENYSSTTSPVVSVTVGSANQAALTLTGITSPAVYGTTQNLGTSGGSGHGTVAYSTGSSTACSVAGFTLTITTGTGTCVVTATKAADANYSSADSAPISLTVTPAPLSVTAANQAINHGDLDPIFAYNTTGFLGSDAFITAPTCTVAGDHGAAATYPIVCSGADAGSNYSISYHSGILTVAAIAPTAPLSLTATAGVREVDFAWSPPADNGGLPVTYNYSYSTDGWVTSTPGTTGNPFFKLLSIGDGVTADLRVSANNGPFVGPVAGEVSATSITLLVPTVSAASWARSVVVNWTGYASGGISVASYEVDWSTDAGATWTGVLLGHSQSTYTIPIPSDNTPVSIRVAARYWSTFGPFTTIVSSTLPKPTLVAIPGVQSVSTTISVVPSLDHGTATNYMVALSSDGGATWSNFASFNLTRTITGLANNTGYLARARIAYGSVWGPWSDSSSVSTVNLPVPTLTASVAPRAITASLDGTTADPTVPAISKWSYETSADGGSTWMVVIVSTSAPKTITGLLDGTAYLVRGRLAYGGSWGPYSANTPLSTPGLIVPVLAATGGSRSVSLTWTLAATPGVVVSGYLLSYSSDGGISWTNVTLPVSPLAYNISGLPDNTDVQIRVNALYGALSGPIGVTTAHTALMATAAPLLTATGGASAVSAAWTIALTSSTLTGYLLEWSTDAGATYSSLKLKATAASYTLPIPGSAVPVTLRLSGLYGTTTGPSSSLNLITLPIPTFSATSTATSLTATISAPPAGTTAASSFCFSYSSDGGITWATFSGSAAVRTLISLTPGTPYLVRVRALYGSAWSSWSASSPISTLLS